MASYFGLDVAELRRARSLDSSTCSMESEESAASIAKCTDEEREGGTLHHIRVHEGARTHSNTDVVGAQDVEAFKAPNVRMTRALTQLLRTLNHREKRELYANLRDPRGDENTLLPKYGASNGELAMLLIVGEEVRYRQRPPRARKTKKENRTALHARRARRLALPPGALSAQRARANSEGGDPSDFLAR